MRLEACGKTQLESGEQLSIQIGKMFGTYIRGKDVETIPLTEIYPITSDSFDTSMWQTYRNAEFGFELKYGLTFTKETRMGAAAGTANKTEYFIIE